MDRFYISCSPRRGVFLFIVQAIYTSCALYELLMLPRLFFGMKQSCDVRRQICVPNEMSVDSEEMLVPCRSG